MRHCSLVHGSTAPEDWLLRAGSCVHVSWKLSDPAQLMPLRSPVDTRGSCTPDSNKGIELVAYLQLDNIARHCYNRTS